MESNDKALFMDSSQYKYYWQKCYAFAKSYTYDTAQAECLASEAMIVLWKKQQGGVKLNICCHSFTLRSEIFLSIT